MFDAEPFLGRSPAMGQVLQAVRGVAFGLNDVLASVELDPQASWLKSGGSLRDAKGRFEREYIAAVLEQHHGRIPEAARTLGIQRTNLYRKMKQLKVHHATSRRPS